MPDPVNLRRFRKSRQRAEKERQAEQNRIAHGRTREERRLTSALNENETRRHEAGRIEKPQDLEKPQEPDEADRS